MRHHSYQTLYCLAIDQDVAVFLLQDQLLASSGRPMDYFHNDAHGDPFIRDPSPTHHEKCNSQTVPSSHQLAMHKC